MTAEVPRYEVNRGPGSTADVDYWRSKPVREVLRSQVSYMVGDTKAWEQQAAQILDTDPAVAAFVKNSGLGFAIPYLHNGQPARLHSRLRHPARVGIFSDSRDEGF